MRKKFQLENKEIIHYRDLRIGEA